MIFQHTWKLILEGKKWETRRPVKPGEIAFDHDYHFNVIQCVTTNTGRVKWEVGKTYAVQPGRGQKAVARRKLLAIRQERLQEMSLDDCAAEGIPQYTFARGCLSKTPPDPRWKYIELWNSINTRKGTRWDENPMVWVLTFEVAI